MLFRSFETGESRLWVAAGSGECPPEFLVMVSALPGVADVLEQVPDSCENSLYAATTVGPATCTAQTCRLHMMH